MNGIPVSAVAVVLLVSAFVGSAWLTLPSLGAAVLTAACLLASAAWAVTGLARPVSSEGVVALYRDWPLDEFLWVFVFGAGALWVLGGAGALVGSRVANWFLWMYALGAGLVNALAHFVFPIVKGGYVPGLYTAPGHLLLSVVLVTALVREDRRLRKGTQARRASAVAVPHA